MTTTFTETVDTNLINSKITAQELALAYIVSVSLREGDEFFEMIFDQYPYDINEYFQAGKESFDLTKDDFCAFLYDFNDINDSIEFIERLKAYILDKKPTSKILFRVSWINLKHYAQA